MDQMGARDGEPADGEEIHRHGNPRQDAEIFTPVHYLLAVLGQASQHGLDVDRLVRLAGVDPTHLDHPEWDVPAEHYSRLLTATIVAMDDELIGYGPAPVPVGSWFIMCHSLIHCETLGDAMRRFCKFFALFRDGLQPRLTIDGDTARIALRPPASHPDFAMACYGLELTVFLIHRFMNWLIRETLPLNTLSFAVAPPPHLVVVQEYFMTTLLQFDAPVTSLTFDRRMLQKRIRQDRQTLDRFLRNGYLELFTTQYAVLSWTARLKAIVGRELANVPEFEEIASRLAIHPQTLRRRLAEEGMTFRQLKVDVRREAALLLLQSTRLSVEQISAQIGFSQASAFTRAFKEWTGQPPYRFRETANGDAA